MLIFGESARSLKGYLSQCKVRRSALNMFRSDGSGLRAS